MSRTTLPQPVKLITSLITGDHDIFASACVPLTEAYGPIDFKSEALPFNFTDYYEKEFGRDLFRHIITFEPLISPDRLPEIKLFTNSLEQRYTRSDGSRQINIDPGYVSLCHLILATAKPFTHRPYLRDGIYADMTLVFRHKTFRRLEWTFPDYGSAELIAILNEIRAAYQQQLERV